MSVGRKEIALFLGLALLLPLTIGLAPEGVQEDLSTLELTTYAMNDGTSNEAWYIDGKFIGGTNGTELRESVSMSDVGLTDHDPIAIDGNTEFSEQATAEGWPGSGTSSDPYLIQCYHIQVNPNGTGIAISNVDLFFSIRVCLIEPADPEADYSPMECVNVTTSHVVDVTSLNASYATQGVLIVGAEDLTIANCLLKECGIAEIQVVESSNVMIKNNTCGGAALGIILEGTNDVTLRENNFQGMEFAACDCVEAVNTTFESNRCEGCTLVLAFDDTIETFELPENNTINGFPIFFRKNIDFAGQTMSGNYGFVFLYNCSNGIFDRLDIDFGTYCADLEKCKNITIQNSSLGAGKIPVALRESVGCAVLNNTIASSPMVGVGILIEDSNSSLAIENIIYNCWMGIYLVQAHENSILGNCVQYNNIGINVDSQSEGNTHINNLIQFNYPLGVRVDGDNNTFLANYFSENGKSNLSDKEWKPSAIDTGTGNVWNTSGVPHGFGNYWANFSSEAHDGILDDPVPILTSGEHYRYDYCALAYPPSTPSAPLELNALSTAKGIELSWSPPSNVSGSAVSSYTVYRLSNSEWIEVGVANGTHFTDTSVGDGISYSYQVSATNLLGAGQLSETLSTTYHAPIDWTVWLTVSLLVVLVVITVAVLLTRRKHST